MRALRPAAALLVAAALAPADAAASRPAPPCTGYIDSIPATIATRGRWCLRKSLATNITSGAAINITAHDVTIDCDRRRITGLNGGINTNAVGIRAVDRDNVRVERCLLSDFHTGIGVSGARPIVEDNLVTLTTRFAIDVAGDAGEVRDNTITYFGGGTIPWSTVTAIRTQGTIDVLDNRVLNGTLRANDSTATGVAVEASDNAGGLVQGNVLVGRFWSTSGTWIGIRIATSPGAIVRGNLLDLFDRGIACDGPTVVAVDNALRFVTNAAPGCTLRGSTDLAARTEAAVPRVPTELRTCDRYIDTLPATIGTAGNYCLRANLGTAIASGVAIEVSATRVSIDCRGFRISGVAGGTASTATGIRVLDGHGAVRNCQLRGFSTGVYSTHDYTRTAVFEDNRIEGAGVHGIDAGGATLVRRNHVRDTGGSTSRNGARYGILGALFAFDNIVDGVSPPAGLAGKQGAIGIYGTFVLGNQVRDIASTNDGIARGLSAGSSSFVQHNRVAAASVGISCVNPTPSLVAGGNTLVQTPTPVEACTDGGNRVVP